MQEKVQNEVRERLNARAGVKQAVARDVDRAGSGKPAISGNLEEAATLPALSARNVTLSSPMPF